MVRRPFWLQRIEKAWESAPIVWLMGVRRVGKTTLANALPDALLLNCDLPSVQARLADPERFFASVGERTLIFDEVHQLPDPSRLLKIGADRPGARRILATGSSTLAATEKFGDSLTGRKRSVLLVPVLWEERQAFGIHDDETRLLRGGLPPALLAQTLDLGFYGEWLDSYYARDVQELFRVEKRAAFIALLETILRQSGGLAEVTHLARACGASRPTVMNYLNVMETTSTVTVLRPYHRGAVRELTHQPKIYGFDTGFVCYARGWDALRPEDHGVLWEHVVLEMLQTLGLRAIHFWRDKSQREVDFVVPRQRDAVDAIECKWSPSGFQSPGLKAFREIHPAGRNFLVVPEPGKAGAPWETSSGGHTVTVVGLEGLRYHYAPHPRAARA